MIKHISDAELNDVLTSGSSLWRIGKVNKRFFTVYELRENMQLGPTVREVTRSSGKVMGQAIHMHVLAESPEAFFQQRAAERAAKQTARDARAMEWEAKLQEVRTANPALETEPFIGSLFTANFVDSQQRACKVICSQQECNIPKPDYTGYMRGVKVDNVVFYSFGYHTEEIRAHSVSSQDAATLYEALVQLIALYAWN